MDFARQFSISYGVFSELQYLIWSKIWSKLPKIAPKTPNPRHRLLCRYLDTPMAKDCYVMLKLICQYDLPSGRGVSRLAVLRNSQNLVKMAENYSVTLTCEAICYYAILCTSPMGQWILECCIEIDLQLIDNRKNGVPH